MSEYASVCILSFNRLEFLQQSIASLDHAGYPIEIVVGDDGSTESVQDWLVDALHDGVISKLYMNPPGHNEGVGSMVNKLFSIATGNPLIKSDQDLLYQPGAIAEFIGVLRENDLARARDHRTGVETEPTLGTLGGFRYWVDPVDHNKMLRAEREHWDEVEDYVSSCMVVPRWVWRVHGPWEQHSDAFAEDIAFKKRLSWLGFAHGLTKKDVVVNRGFGVGPSTVVVRGDSENGHVVQSIHHEPRIFSGP